MQDPRPRGLGSDCRPAGSTPARNSLWPLSLSRPPHSLPKPGPQHLLERASDPSSSLEQHPPPPNSGFCQRGGSGSPGGRSRCSLRKTPQASRGGRAAACSLSLNSSVVRLQRTREHLYISSPSFPDSCLVYEGSEAASLPAPPPRASLAGGWVAGTALARIATGQRGTGVGKLGQPRSFTLLGLPLTSASPGSH